MKRKCGPRKTKDEGIYETGLGAPRRSVTIAQKLEVVEFYDKLKKQKVEAKNAVKEPRPVGATKEEMQDYRKRIREARQISKTSVKAECERKFGSIIGRCQPIKWSRTAEREKWHLIPEHVRANEKATQNGWRTKMGLPQKGKKVGGSIPLELQFELDLLISEMAAGRSLVTERREVVTTEDVATC